MHVSQTLGDFDWSSITNALPSVAQTYLQIQQMRNQAAMTQAQIRAMQPPPALPPTAYPQGYQPGYQVGGGSNLPRWLLPAVAVVGGGVLLTTMMRR